MDLVPITADWTTDARIGASELARAVCAATVEMYATTGAAAPWIGYLAFEDGTPVGTCAFKGPPDAQGVEIAYFTFPDCEGSGVARRMAANLVEIASRAGVATVRAQTLPEPNASTRVLERLGFERVATVEHPTDGTVWEWLRTGA